MPLMPIRVLSAGILDVFAVIPAKAGGAFQQPKGWSSIAS
jgi:hypothetical protein